MMLIQLLLKRSRNVSETKPRSAYSVGDRGMHLLNRCPINPLNQKSIQKWSIEYFNPGLDCLHVLCAKKQANKIAVFKRHIAIVPSDKLLIFLCFFFSLSLSYCFLLTCLFVTCLLSEYHGESQAEKREKIPVPPGSFSLHKLPFVLVSHFLLQVPSFPCLVSPISISRYPPLPNT